MKKLTLLEQSVLLGILPLLGLTARVAEALVAVVSVAVITVVLSAVAKAIRGNITPEFTTPILAALGLGLAYIVYAVGPFVLPVSADSALYVLLLGVTPLVYIGCLGNEHSPPMLPALVRFSVVALVLGVVRELIAFGTLLEMQMIPVELAPYGAANLAPNAFLFVGVLIILARLVKKNGGETNKEAAA